MYIKSQAHTIDVVDRIINTEIATLSIAGRAVKAKVIGEPDAVTLGVYSSKENVQEVFDDIFQKLDYDTIYQMPEYE